MKVGQRFYFNGKLFQIISYNICQKNTIDCVCTATNETYWILKETLPQNTKFYNRNEHPEYYL